MSMTQLATGGAPQGALDLVCRLTPGGSIDVQPGALADGSAPAEAYQFLRETEAYERAGLIVRLPDWWSAKNKPRPKVSVSIGGKAPSSLGVDALLSFDVGLTLDGKKLTKAEIEKLLGESRGLPDGRRPRPPVTRPSRSRSRPRVRPARWRSDRASSGVACSPSSGDD